MTGDYATCLSFRSLSKANSTRAPLLSSPDVSVSTGGACDVLATILSIISLSEPPCIHSARDFNTGGVVVPRSTNFKTKLWSFSTTSAPVAAVICRCIG